MFIKTNILIPIDPVDFIVYIFFQTPKPSFSSQNPISEVAYTTTPTSEILQINASLKAGLTFIPPATPLTGL
jgi:hypothetical protein